MRCFLLHGINTFDGGKGYIGQFRPLLIGEGIDAKLHGYSASWLPGLQWALNGGRARELAEVIGDDPCVILAHSNGCAIAMEAAAMGAPVRNLVFLNPALDRKAKLPAHVGRCDVFYTTDDPWTQIAMRLPFHPWGDMGASGYRGADERYVSWNMSKGIRRQACNDVSAYPAATTYTVDGVRVFRNTVEGWLGKRFVPEKHSGVKLGKDPQAFGFWAPLIVEAVVGRLP